MKSPGIDLSLLTDRQMTRLLGSVDRSAGAEGCWPWTGTYFRAYGAFRIGLGRRGKIRSEQAHRVVYKLMVGPIPDGLFLDHLCRNPPCVNPAHLEPVTSRVNTLRGETLAAAQIQRSHCPRGHEYSGQNLYVAPDRRRHCRTCMADYERSRVRVRRQRGVR